jgi:hypothetical protein
LQPHSTIVQLVAESGLPEPVFLNKHILIARNNRYYK